MPAETHPGKAELVQLTLRAAVALAVRCARRVQPILAPRGDLLEASQKSIALAEEFARGQYREPRVTSAIASAASVTLPSPGATPFPPDPRLALAHAMGAAREAAKAVAGVSVIGSQGPADPPFFPSAEDLLSHAANAIDQAARTTSISNGFPLVPEDIHRLCAARHPRQTQECVWAAQAIRSDFETLKRLHPGDGDKLGTPIDPSEDGDLGPLWPAGTPRWYAELSPAVLPVRLPVVVLIDPRQKPQDVRHGPEGSAGAPDVFCLSVGEDAGAFPSTPAALAWVRGIRASASPGPSPTLIVLASPSPTVSEDEERGTRSDLVYDCGAAAFPRGYDVGAFPDWIAVQARLPPVLTVRRPGLAPANPGTIGLPPASARGYGRQPAHVDEYDPVQFEKVVERLNEAEWWELDY